MGRSLLTTTPRGDPGRTLLRGANSYVMDTVSRLLAATVYTLVWVMLPLR